MEINGTELSTADLALWLALAGVAVVLLKWGLAKYQAANADGKVTLDEVLDIADDAVDEVKEASKKVQEALAEFREAKAKEEAAAAEAEAEAEATTETEAETTE